MKNKLITKIVEESVIQDLYYDNFDIIRGKKVFKTLKAVFIVAPITEEIIKQKSREIIDSKSEDIELKLTEISLEKLKELRNSNIPCFVMKYQNGYFYAELPEGAIFNTIQNLDVNMCSIIGKECDRLKAASDEDGGCAKVRKFATNIEQYPFIEYGYETFNTKRDIFVVLECSHYKKPKFREKERLFRYEHLKF